MSQTYNPPSLPTRRTRILLLVVWALLSLNVVALVLVCVPNSPAEEEWEFVGVLVGNEPLGPWLWAHPNEHRQPLSRLLYYVEFRSTRDFRAGMLLQVAMLSALSLGLMRLAANLRGRPDWPDLFFPVSLLHPGHWGNFLLGYQLRYALFLVFATGLVVVALRAQRQIAFRAGVIGGVLLFFAALTGGPGLALVPPVVVWLGYLTVVVARTEGRGKAALVAVLALASVFYLAIDLIGSERPERHLPPIADVLMVALKVLATAPGVGVSGVWWAVAGAEIAIGAATIALLVRRVNDPAERPGSIGVIAVVTGISGVVAIVAVEWAGLAMNPAFWSRISFLTWPLLGAAFLVWVKAGRKWVPIGLCIATALAFPTNLGAGMVHAAGIASVHFSMENDLRAGVPDNILIHTHFPNSRNADQEARALTAIPMLRDARIGLFAREGQDTSALWWLAVEVLAVAVAGRWLWSVGRAVQAERARELFRLQHERFEEQLLSAASATGLPRGLLWVSCAINGDALLVRDVATSSIVALVPVVIQFDPVEGSEMEGVPAAREPRPATAVFIYTRGTWETAGRVVFNHTPEQTVANYAPQYRIIEHGHH